MPETPAHAVARRQLRRLGLLLALPLLGALASVSVYGWVLSQTLSAPVRAGLASEQVVLSLDLRHWAAMVAAGQALGQAVDRSGLRARIDAFDGNLDLLRNGGTVGHGGAGSGVLEGKRLPPAPVDLRDDLDALAQVWNQIRPSLLLLSDADATDSRSEQAWNTVQNLSPALQEAADQVAWSQDARSLRLRQGMFYSLFAMGVFLLVVPIVGYVAIRQRVLQPILDVDIAAQRFMAQHGHTLARVTAGDAWAAPTATFQAMAAEIGWLFDQINGQRRYAEGLIESVPVGILVLDSDLVVKQANPAFYPLCESCPSPAAGRHISEIRCVAELLDQATDVLSTGQPRHGLLVHHEVEGGPDRSLRVAIGPRGGGESGLLIVLEDLTQEHRLRVVALAAEKSFRELIEQSPDAIAVYRDGRFIYVNPAMVGLLGYPSEDALVGTRVSSVVHKDDHPLMAARHQAMSISEQSTTPQEERLLRKDGSVVHVEVVAIRLEYRGSPAIVVVARDITQRTALTARMMEMDRIIAIGTLAAGVGHEINNPLTFVSGNVRFGLESLDPLRSFIDAIAVGARQQIGEPLAQDLLDNAGFAQARTALQDLAVALADAREGSDRIRDIVRDLKTLSRGSDTQLGNLDLHAVITTAIDMAYHEIRHRARLVKDFGKIPPVAGSDGRLGQVFLNLLINAAQAIPEGAVDHNEIRVRTFVEDGAVVIEVSDSGGGIRPEDRDRLFDAFFTTKPVGQGTGLGLAICRQIIQTHGGSIQVHSKLGQGSTFRVVLPAVVQAEAPPSPSVEAAEDPEDAVATPRRARILVIDDEPMIGRLTKRMLGSDHDVQTVDGAREALDRIDSGQVYDVIFCDLMMPEITGMELYQILVERYPDLARRVVFVTGGAFTPRAQEFLSAPGRRHLHKPFEVQQVLSVVQELLA
ncbi:MAG: PAS domain S-box protein [Oligoflexia bacterium]|nr:PAS domain S-box protein [Oligoflexia bacterium]